MSAIPVSVSNNKALLLALAASCVLALVLQGQTLWQPQLITDDIVQHHVWLDAGKGSGFQPDDPWVAISKGFQPYMVAEVFKTVRLFLPTLLVGKAIALLLLTLTGFLFFQTGSSLGGRRLGWVAMGLFFVSDAWIGFSGGFARSFAWPLVCGFLLSMLNGRSGWAAVCLFLAGALYPIAFVLLCPAYALAWLTIQAFKGWRHTWDLRAHLRSQWPLLLAVAAGAALMLLKSRELGLHPFVGPNVTLAEIQTDPVYRPGGRVVLWPPVPLHAQLPWALMPWGKAMLEPVLRHLGAYFTGGMMSAGLLLVSVVSFGLAMVIVWRRSREKAVVLMALAVAAILTFELAELLLPRLFESSRYLIWSMPLLGVFMCAVLMDAALGFLPKGRTRQAGILALAVLLASRAPAIRSKGAEDVSEYSALYSALVRTGGEEMIACFPRTADFIPVLCHRSIYVSHETSAFLHFSRCRDLVMERQNSLLKALYSANRENVRDFCARDVIHWLVVEEKYYRPETVKGSHFAPFEQQILDMLQTTPEPWLLTYARKSGKQVQPGVYLLNTGPIIDSPAQP